MGLFSRDRTPIEASRRREGPSFRRGARFHRLGDRRRRCAWSAWLVCVHAGGLGQSDRPTPARHRARRSRPDSPPKKTTEPPVATPHRTSRLPPGRPPPRLRRTGGCQDKNPRPADPAGRRTRRGHLAVRGRHADPAPGGRRPGVTDADGVRPASPTRRPARCSRRWSCSARSGTRTSTAARAEQPDGARPGPRRRALAAEARTTPKPAQRRGSVRRLQGARLPAEPDGRSSRSPPDLNNKRVGAMPVTLSWSKGDWKWSCRRTAAQRPVEPGHAASLCGYVRFRGA